MLQRDEDGKLLAYAWPGGYPIYYLDKDNCILCPECANKEAPEDVIAAGVHWDGEPLVCEECNTQIESAYGPIEE